MPVLPQGREMECHLEFSIRVRDALSNQIY